MPRGGEELRWISEKKNIVELNSAKPKKKGVMELQLLSSTIYYKKSREGKQGRGFASRGERKGEGFCCLANEDLVMECSRFGE